MATVYITQQLRNDITRVINRMSDKEVEDTVPNARNSISVDASELANRAAWGDHYHLIKQLPPDWLKQPGSVDINVTVGIDEDGKPIKETVSFTGLTYYKERPSIDRWGAPRPEVTKQWLEANTHMTPAEMALVKLEDIATRNEIQLRWQKTDGDIRTFLNKCKSLNEALKLWPGVQLYIPASYIERVNTKVDRKSRTDDVLASVDIGELTAAAIAAKLSGVSA